MTDRTDIGADNLAGRGDDFYAALMQAHEGLDFEDSSALNARLVLILANMVGDLDRLRAAIDAAVDAGAIAGPTAPGPPAGT